MNVLTGTQDTDDNIQVGKYHFHTSSSSSDFNVQVKDGVPLILIVMENTEKDSMDSALTLVDQTARQIHLVVKEMMLHVLHQLEIHHLLDVANLSLRMLMEIFLVNMMKTAHKVNSGGKMKDVESIMAIQQIMENVIIPLVFIFLRHVN